MTLESHNLFTINDLSNAHGGRVSAECDLFIYKPNSLNKDAETDFSLVKNVILDERMSMCHSRFHNTVVVTQDFT